MKRLFCVSEKNFHAEASLKRYIGEGNYTDLLEGTDSRRFTFGVEILF